MVGSCCVHFNSCGSASTPVASRPKVPADGSVTVVLRLTPAELFSTTTASWLDANNSSSDNAATLPLYPSVFAFVL